MTVEEKDPTTGSREKLKRPQKYTVVFLNDDFTPMEFVVQILKEIFGQGDEAAYSIMLAIHNQGRGKVGLYTFEVAETKVSTTMDLARRHGHPLRCDIEPA